MINFGSGSWIFIEDNPALSEDMVFQVHSHGPQHFDNLARHIILVLLLYQYILLLATRQIYVLTSRGI